MKSTTIQNIYIEGINKPAIKSGNFVWCLLLVLFSIAWSTSSAQEMDSLVTIEGDSYEYWEEESEIPPPPPPSAEPIEIEYPEESQEKVWTNEQWDKARKGIEYVKPEEEKDEKEDEEGDDEFFDDANIDDDEPFGEWLSSVVTSPLGKLIAILFIGILLVLLIIQLFSSKNSLGKEKVTTIANILSENVEELPEESDLDRYLRLAIESGDYKSATRILFLKIIRQLDLQSFIKWKKDKTNRDYLNEMRLHESYGSFREVTFIYEVVWYGDTNIDQTEYHKFSHLFENYHNRINDSKEIK